MRNTEFSTKLIKFSLSTYKRNAYEGVVQSIQGVTFELEILNSTLFIVTSWELRAFSRGVWISLTAEILIKISYTHTYLIKKKTVGLFDEVRYLDQYLYRLLN